MIKKIVKNLLVFLSFVCITFAIYLKITFNEMSFEQIIYNFIESKGFSLSAVIEGVVFVGGLSAFLTILIYLLKSFFNKKNWNITFSPKFKGKKFSFNLFRMTNKQSWLITILFFLSALTFLIFQVGLIDYFRMQLTDSTFIEENYVDSRKVKITFPESKQNLIYIIVESLEMTNASVKNLGGLKTSYIPKLEKLALNNINFSNTEKLGGFYDLTGTTWTAASMMAQTSGVPLKVSIDGNNYFGYGKSLPGAYSIGEVLEKNGYHNYLMLGSYAEFGGRKDYFTYHGDYTIFDYNYAIDNELIPDDYFVWWGYEDNKLYEFAKSELKEIAQKNEPFNFTLLTADTHPTNGYLDDSCPTPFEEHYANAYNCADIMLSEFINWLKKQDFYKDTTIVIVGDHKTMQNNYYENLINNYDRVIYNTFINSKVSTNNSKNRLFSTFDLYPTTLAALGATIEGDKLGLGVNLFSNEKTLVEKYGVKYLNAELAKKSSFYNNFILGDTYYQMLEENKT